MDHWFIGAVLTFFGGIAVSYLNYIISLLVMRSRPEVYPMTAVLRQIVNAAYLAAVYFLAPHTPWNLIPLLVGAALGTTLSIFVFTYLLVKKNDAAAAGTQNETNTTSEKGDE